jgi:MFS family permease
VKSENDPSSSSSLLAFGIERNVVAASSSAFLLGLGEELWKRFLPKYLEALGGGPLVVGLFGTARDFLDAIYQYPGGWLSDHLGRRASFLIFIGLAALGYFVYLLSPSWHFVFLGLGLSMAWQSMASPAIFAVIGDALPKERRAMGFTILSLVKRVPMIIAPIIGGMLIASMGIMPGIRTALAITIALAVLTVFVVLTVNVPLKIGEATNMRGVWNSFHWTLKRLLISDIIIRTCEGMTDIFVVIYVTNSLGVGLADYGVLVAIQMTTSILVYIPAAKIADRIGRKPFVIATFASFALFPLAVILSNGFYSLSIAFMIGGLREIGEPSRKAMIVDFARADLRARSVGLYYLVRSLSITPAAFIGGVLWKIAPQAPFVTAGVIGLIGTVVFAMTVEEKYAG